MTTQPLRLGPFARRRLSRAALRDAAAVHDRDASSQEASTPTVAGLQARADGFARREEERFFRHMRRELTEHRVVTAALRADLDAYEERLDRLPDADRYRLHEGSGPAVEELRRLERRIRSAHRRSDQLSALINARFTTAQLRAARMFDRSDEKAAVYWGALRNATSGRVGPHPPVLRRAGWLTSRSTAVDALHPIAPHEADHRRTDAPA
ncbi:hypothetical protein [Leifsonia sp. SIMBA_070]|uniref:hypothetical protein n=1 Tax=Leifsonia sp. SIMBA_070 TaxID=3085810 RepID=UPI00397CE359